jgi:hypothetical protein
VVGEDFWQGIANWKPAAAASAGEDTFYDLDVQVTTVT